MRAFTVVLVTTSLLAIGGMILTYAASFGG